MLIDPYINVVDGEAPVAPVNTGEWSVAFISL